MIERRHQHFSKYLSGGTHHVCKRPTLDVRTSPTLDVLCGRRAIMIETQKNCKARNSNKSTKESVKPEVAFQVGDCGARDARPKCTQSKRHQRDARQRERPERPQNTKQIPAENWRQTTQLGGDGHLRKRTRQQKRVTACAFLPKAMP